MKRRSLVTVLCLLTLFLLRVGSAEPSAGAGQARRPPVTPVHLPIQRALDPAAAPVRIPLAASGWTTLMSEDFEGDFPGSSWEVCGDPTWGRTTYKARSGSASAYCAAGGAQAVNPPGPYPHNMDAWMIRGPFDLSQATDAELSFQHSTKTELAFDQFWVVAFTDGEKWGGKDWSGDLTATCDGWCAETVSLQDFPGLGNLCGQSQVWVGFEFVSDDSISDEGTYLDDVVLRAWSGQPSSTPTATATNPPGPTRTATPTPTGSVTEQPTPTRTPTGQPTPGGPSKAHLPIVRKPLSGVASKVVRTNEEAVIHNASGASLSLPRGAASCTVRWWIRSVPNSARGAIHAPARSGAPNDEVLVTTSAY